MAIDVDDVLEKIGPNGKFQVRTVLLLSLPCFCRSLFVLSSTFIQGEPPWRCVKNSTICTLSGEYKVGMPGYKQRCSMKRKEWEFVDDFTSVTTEWDLVCDRAILNTVIASLFFAGYLMGAVVLGYLSDRYGRRKAAYFALVISSLVAFSASFSPSMQFYSVTRFGIGFFGGGSGMILFIICVEVTGIKHRGTAGTALWFSWVLGTLSIALFAFIFRDWRDLSLAFGIIHLSVIPLWWFIPESPRWLVANGHTKEAIESLQKIADVNGAVLPVADLKTTEVETKSTSFFDLFMSKKYSKRTLIQWLTWTVSALVYYCVSLGTAHVGGNLYVTYSLICLVELPATFAVMWMIIKFGRKTTVISCLWVAAFTCTLVAFFPAHQNVGNTVCRIALALIAKFFITVAFDSLFVWSGELFPTVLRNIGLGSCSSAARVGSFLSSYVNHLAIIHPFLPFGFMAITAIVAGSLCCFLPETAGQSTLDDLDKDPKIPHKIEDKH